MLRQAIYEKCAGISGGTISALTTVGSASLALAAFADGGWCRRLLLVAGVVLSIVAIVLGYCRSKGIGQKLETINQVRTEAAAERDALLATARKERAHLLDKDLKPLLELLGEALSTADADERRSLAQKVRQGVVVAAATVVAPDAPAVRANLFRRASARLMTLDPGCFYGRGDKSRRKFRPGDETWDAMMSLDYRLVTEVEEPNRRYGSYITVPIASADTQEGIHGVLTVDAPGSEDLSVDDLPFLELLANIAAVSYRVEALKG
ncbi:GAF domain-containing protein [Gordonia sihwensis]|uniref:GAF domain-containing protein n=1 Tax=Gordonia sihwensis NBRC 108236 TaxID=1223544 RepID=L7LH16_9ACTN|nr:GAF domain-containing protein [Gordonia sihwensis]GAC59358.1 hypothetical protein GSI01S_01_03250 [Gordonia sihwensis NBRC 108236]